MAPGYVDYVKSSSRAVDAVALTRRAAARGASTGEPLGGEPQVRWLFLVQAAASVGELPDRSRGRWIDPVYGELPIAVASDAVQRAGEYGVAEAGVAPGGEVDDVMRVQGLEGAVGRRSG